MRDTKYVMDNGLLSQAHGIALNQWTTRRRDLYEVIGQTRHPSSIA